MTAFRSTGLRYGTAQFDTGLDVLADGDVVVLCLSLYSSVSVPVFRTDWASAELSKYACNGFMAVKASRTNELADLCTAMGADVPEVTAVMAASSTRETLDAAAMAACGFSYRGIGRW